MEISGRAGLAGRRYSRVAMGFHWIIALLIMVNLLVGYLHEELGRSARAAALTAHKSIGLTVLLLSLGRLAWRLGHRPPAFDSVMRGWEVLLARAAHGLFYVLLIALPLSGWLMSSSSGRSIPFFWLVTVPALPVAGGGASHELWESVHSLLAYGMLILLFLHLAGVAKHWLQGQRHMIGRMGPWLAEPQVEHPGMVEKTGPLS